VLANSTKEEETIKSGVLENTETGMKQLHRNKQLEENQNILWNYGIFYALIRNNFKAPNQSGLNGKSNNFICCRKDGTLTDFKILKIWF
jgi:hypothetical protein